MTCFTRIHKNDECTTCMTSKAMIDIESMLCKLINLYHQKLLYVRQALCFAGEKLDPRVAVGGRYVSQEPPGNDTTASTTGREQSEAGQGYWQSGLFDKGSWIEAQSGWARSVITGRARLAGVACGGSLWPCHLMLRLCTQLQVCIRQHLYLCISSGRADLASVACGKEACLCLGIVNVLCTNCKPASVHPFTHGLFGCTGVLKVMQSSSLHHHGSSGGLDNVSFTNMWAHKHC